MSVIERNRRYELSSERVVLSGTQALVRLALMQRALDAVAGEKTAGYVSGYRGSPLGAVDQTFVSAQQYLDASDIRLHMAVNEDLAATAIWGTQQVGLFGPTEYGGVFAMWYGKGPGVHRSGDVFLHANLAGTSKLGGVVAIAGDDHTCKSSTNAHQSEYSFVDAMMPTLNPAGVQDILDLGLYGWALSRFSGCWTGMKLVADTVDSSASVHGDPDRVRIAIPEREGGVAPENRNIRWPDTPVEQERRLHEEKLPAALAFARANRLDKVVLSPRSSRIGVIAAGKSYLDTLHAFELLGLTQSRAAELGVSLYKVALVWPLEPEGVTAFCDGLDHVVVIEEKRPLIESQVKEILYNMRADRRPAVHGKMNSANRLALPAYSDLTPNRIATHILDFLPELGSVFSAGREEFARPLVEAPAAARVPYFCSGCPHNSSTKVPNGSKSFAGIGCHYMALWMNRNTEGFTQMGGEGANWIGCSPFSQIPHMFQNMGDGTYFHSGHLAIRAAVSANVNITYKILFNDAVAMTGGQKVDGELSSLVIARQMAAEGVKRIAIVSQSLPKRSAQIHYPTGTTFHQRHAMDRVQKELRIYKGVSILIFDQACAAELRRRRKRSIVDEPPARVVINELVCEGCGDCSSASNCMSVRPVETEYGAKRQIDQSSCNKDYSCIDGFCPSFVTVSGGQLRKGRSDLSWLPQLTEMTFSPPRQVKLDEPYSILVAGVGGTGVVTIGALIATAAELEGKACTTLDMTGMAQKGGAVTSHVRIANTSEDLNAVRIAQGRASLVLGCDLVVSSSEEVLSLTRRNHTQVVLNTANLMTAASLEDRDYRLPTTELRRAILRQVSTQNVLEVDATEIATSFLGNSIATNLFMVGVAYQHGLIPVEAESIKKAILANGVAQTMNLRAFALGRLWIVDGPKIAGAKASPFAERLSYRRKSRTLQEATERRKAFLKDYQDGEYSRRYERLVEHVGKCESQVAGAVGRLTQSVAENFFKLMAVKDEYETARLFTSESFSAMLKEQFSGNLKLTYHLAPPGLSPRNKETGVPRKIRFGGWMRHVYRLLAKMKWLRGSAFDVFGYTDERRLDRAIRDRYECDMYTLSSELSLKNYEAVIALAAIPDRIKGFGHVRAAAIRLADAERDQLLKGPLIVVERD